MILAASAMFLEAFFSPSDWMILALASREASASAAIARCILILIESLLKNADLRKLAKQDLSIRLVRRKYPKDQ